MPTLEWNRYWTRALAEWRSEHPARPFGDQWGDPSTESRLLEVRDRFLLPFVRPWRTALEIGSGGGRWTQFMLGFERLFCVEVNPEMFAYLLERFGPRANVSYCHTNGTDFPGVRPASVDFVFTFGTFVHLDPPLIGAYLANLRPILKPEADVVLQYADKEKPDAAANPTFATTTAAVMDELLLAHGYRILEEERELLPHSNVVHARPANG